MTNEDEKDWAEDVWDSQMEWIMTNLGEDAARGANYGWSIDDVDKRVCTKVYGHGVLTTDEDLNHNFEAF